MVSKNTPVALCHTSFPICCAKKSEIHKIYLFSSSIVPVARNTWQCKYSSVMDYVLNSKTAFSTREASRLCGLSTYMVDYLCRARLVVPSMSGRRGRGRGKERRYSFGDVVLLRTYSRLLATGVSVKRLKDAQKTWSRYYKTMDGQTPPTRLLISDGERVMLLEKANVISELNKDGQLAFSFIVDLRTIFDEVRDAMVA